MRINSTHRKLTNAGYAIRETQHSQADGLALGWIATHPSGMAEIEYHRNGRSDSVSSIRARKTSDRDDIITDYCAGSFANSIRKAMDLAEKMAGWEQEKRARASAA